jgi:hypothetical protein
VAEAALNLLTERSFENFLIANLRGIFPTIHKALKEVSVEHWSSEIRDLAKKTSNTISLLTPKVYQDSWKKEMPQTETDTRKMQVWLQIAEGASRNGYPTKEKIDAISQEFGIKRSPMRSQLRKPKRGSAESMAMSWTSLTMLVDVDTPLMRSFDSLLAGLNSDVGGG